MAHNQAKQAGKRIPTKRAKIVADGLSIRFEPVKVEALFEVLDAIAWLQLPNCKLIAQFAGVDPRTAGKLLKNGVAIGLIEEVDGQLYSLALPYPYKGTSEQKTAVVKEALVRMPLLSSIRQFLRLGEPLEASLRKAATVAGIADFDASTLTPLLQWARALNALDPKLIVEDLVETASEAKEERHRSDAGKKVAFLSHSSKDKPLIRQLAADLTANGITVWLDEQRIRVGDSIPESIAQGLAESDFFLIALSHNSVGSAWVKRELNSALMAEVSKRKIAVLPLKLDSCEIPSILQDKRYADFSASYKTGLDDLLNTIKAKAEHG